MGKTVEVPQRGKRWTKGSLVTDGRDLYRVTGPSRRYHEDCLPVQPVSRPRNLPEDWTAAKRLLEIVQQMEQEATHSPDSRGATADKPVGAVPQADGQVTKWTARTDANSLASYPWLQVQDDIVVYIRPNYDDSPTVIWMRSQDLADEVRRLAPIAAGALCRYPRASVRG